MHRLFCARSTTILIPTKHGKKRNIQMRFQGNTDPFVLLEPPRCAFPSCTDWGEHQHHITYDPPVTKRLCVQHHEEITIINGQQARKYRRSLSNKHRWWIWFQWIEGKLKPRRTRKALEYTEEWSAGSATSGEETRCGSRKQKQEQKWKSRTRQARPNGRENERSIKCARIAKRSGGLV